jgi:micrococcal nuclease
MRLKFDLLRKFVPCEAAHSHSEKNGRRFGSGFATARSVAAARDDTAIWNGRQELRITFLAVTLLIAPSAMADPTILTGDVTKVRDGDTIEVGKIPIRLNGVSAPEMREPLGHQSKSFMVDFVMGKRVRCELDGTKTHDRWVSICYLNGRDIGAAVIGAGLALDCPRYSSGRYAKLEVPAAALRMRLPKYCEQ